MYQISKIANFYIPSLYNEISSQKIHGDIVITIHLFQNSKYCLFPVKSRVRNNGHDGTGANCITFEDDLYKKQELYKGTKKLNLNIEIKKNKIIYRKLAKHFKVDKLRMIKFQLKNYYSFLKEKLK